MSGEVLRPSRDLTGRVAIVTGAGSEGDGIGNGRASALLLAEAGATVICGDLNGANAERTVAMIQEEGFAGRGHAITMNVTNENECSAAVTLALEQYGRLDILVNNVGITGAKGTAETVDMDAWAVGMEINVASMVKMAKYAIPAMKRNEPTARANYRGAIVNIGSVAGLRGGTPSLLYPTTKGAVVNMTRAMAANHAADGIRVNCVCPGMLFTPMMSLGQGTAMTDEHRASRKERSLLKTEGNGYDAGAAVRWLASEESRWVTGQMLVVDAGTTCSTSIIMG